MMFTFAFSSVAEAKRMGGKTMGKTYKVAPTNMSKKTPNGGAADPTKQGMAQNQAAAQPQKSSPWGMLGGALAGLAAGGLLASLFGRGI